jgi:manganese/iron transport system substrate-binding protein
MVQKIILGFALLVLVLAACAPARSDQTNNGETLKIVATTTLISDVAGQIAGSDNEVTSLLPYGSDPHSFQPTPQDLAKVAEADIIFTNGLGLEEFLDSLIENSGTQAKVIVVSDGIQPLEAVGEPEGEHDAENHTGSDPHVWTDPNNVLIWVDNIEKIMREVDPAKASIYETNAAAYRQELTDLDTWIQEQVTQVPEDNRKLVTDHTIFAYFANRYGFEQIGAVIPSYSTAAEPSAQELAALEDVIRDLGVKAIFVGETVNPSLSQRVAEDTNAQLVFVHSGSLTGEDGTAPTYLEYIRYNVNALVSALK